MVLVGRDGEARQLDVLADDVGVDELVLGEALADEELAAVDVVGVEAGVGAALGQGDHLAVAPGGVLAEVAAVGPADAADEADVVAQERDDVHQPVVRADAALAHVLAAEDLLADQGDQDGVLDVVVQGIAVGDVLQGHAPDPADDVLVVGLQPAVHAPVALAEFLPDRYAAR